MCNVCSCVSVVCPVCVTVCNVCLCVCVCLCVVCVSVCVTVCKCVSVVCVGKVLYFKARSRSIKSQYSAGLSQEGVVSRVLILGLNSIREDKENHLI